MRKFSENIRKVMKRWGMTQTEFAEWMGYNISTFNSYLIGKAKPSILFFLRLETKTGIPVMDFLTKQISMKEIPENPFTRDVIDDSGIFRIVSLNDSGQIIEDPGVPYESKYEKLERRVAELERRLDNLTDAIERLLNQKL